MIKAEVIPHDGYEVPNWVSKCRGAITSLPAITTFAVVIISIVVLFVWHNQGSQLVNETGAQSQPASSTSLQVVSSDNLPVPAASALTSSSQAVGPASTSSRDSLQPTGLTQNNAPGLSQAAQSVQNPGQASPRALSNFGL
ncbi:MAG TPA: hypothetical protein VFI84_02895 [Candidatus Saccharimonadales bacterium]|nr:hypothetical protein [Candidatus Saccharimonadales bacterium]